MIRIAGYTNGLDKSYESEKIMCKHELKVGKAGFIVNDILGKLFILILSLHQAIKMSSLTSMKLLISDRANFDKRWPN